MSSLARRTRPHDRSRRRDRRAGCGVRRERRRRTGRSRPRRRPPRPPPALQGLDVRGAAGRPVEHPPAVASLADLPMLFVFQGPTVRTRRAPSGTPAPSAPQLPGVEQIPGSAQVPGLDAVPTPDAAVPAGALAGALEPAADAGGGRAPPTDRSTRPWSTPAQVGALAGLDTASVGGGPGAGAALVDQQGFDMSAGLVGGRQLRP